MTENAASSRARASHWDAAYVTRGATEVSWFQTEPIVSLELIEALGVARDSAVIDIGGGASLLVDHLVGRASPTSPYLTFRRPPSPLLGGASVRALP